jgi:hypothetical protein
MVTSYMTDPMIYFWHRIMFPHFRSGAPLGKTLVVIKTRTVKIFSYALVSGGTTVKF